jgi:hypothetical protein
MSLLLFFPLVSDRMEHVAYYHVLIVQEMVGDKSYNHVFSRFLLSFFIWKIQARHYNAFNNITFLMHDVNVVHENQGLGIW